MPLCVHGLVCACACASAQVEAIKYIFACLEVVEHDLRRLAPALLEPATVRVSRPLCSVSLGLWGLCPGPRDPGSRDRV